MASDYERGSGVIREAFVGTLKETLGETRADGFEAFAAMTLDVPSNMRAAPTYVQDLHQAMKLMAIASVEAARTSAETHGQNRLDTLDVVVSAAGFALASVAIQAIGGSEIARVKTRRVVTDRFRKTFDEAVRTMLPTCTDGDKRDG